jgi:hypothetical protein
MFAREMLIPPRIIPLKITVMARRLPISLSMFFLLIVSPFLTI